MIRASVLARLLGIRLLRLEADIAVVAAVPGPPALPGERMISIGSAERGGGLAEAAALLRQASRTLDGGAARRRAPPQ